MKKLISILAIGLIAMFLFQGCVDKEFDEPDFPFADPDIETNTTIVQFKSLFKGTYVQIEDDLTFSAVVIANDSTGNFYKKILVQDETGGLEILIDGRDMFSKYPVGRRVFIKAKGLVLDDYNGVKQLGLVISEGDLIAIPFKDADKYIIGGSLHNNITPKVIGIRELTQEYIGTLVKFENVEFTKGDALTTFADGFNKKDEDRYIYSCLEDTTVIIRTSGYSKFAYDNIPDGNGSVIGVVSVYGSTYQIFLRDIKEVVLNAERCSGSIESTVLFKDFNNKSITSGGWEVFNLVGNVDWTIGTYDNRLYGNITNYSGGSNSECDTWLVSPKVDISLLEYPTLNFISACSYYGDLIEVYVSNNYSPYSTPDISQWTQLVPVLSAGNFVWTNSGFIDLSDFKSSEINIAFRYIGTNSSGKAWEIDDIDISSNKPKATLFKEDFELGLENWNAVSVVGDEKWIIDNIHGNPGACAKMSGYSGGSHENEDWLISKEIDATQVNTLFLSFDNAKNYSGNDLQVYISTNYSGSGNPNDANWEEINYTKSTGSFTYVNSGSIDIGSFSGDKLYLAFKYSSSISASSTWEIDNVKVFE